MLYVAVIGNAYTTDTRIRLRRAFGVHDKPMGLNSLITSPQALARRLRHLYNPSLARGPA